MRIAVLADTHGKLPPTALPSLSEADEIWHLGDYCDAVILNSIIALGRPFHGVLGNNDSGLALPHHLLLERAGHTFLLIHIPPAGPKGVDFLLHGHTHVPRDEKIGDMRVLNPGSMGKPNKGAPPSWAWLILHPDGEVDWKIVPIEQFL